MKSLNIISEIIPKSFRYKTVFLFFLFLLGSLLEIVSIGMFAPLISELTNSKIPLIEEIKNILSPYLTNKDQANWSEIFLIMLVGIFLIKNLILSFIIYYKNNYIQFLTIELSTKLLDIYLNQEFLFHKKNNSSKLIRNINVEISTFITFLTSFIIIISEALFLTGILIFLLLFNYLVTISVIFLFFLLFFIYSKLFDNTLSRLGKIRHKYANIAINNLQQSLGGIKEIKVGNLENKFLFLFKLTSQKIASSVSKYSTLQQLPRLIIELFVVIFGSLLLLISIHTVDNTYLLTLVGIFTLVAIKTAPSATKIYSALQYATFSMPSVFNLHKEINLKFTKKINNKEVGEKLLFNSLSFKSVSFKYPSLKKNSLEKISFQIKRGEKIAIVGESGAGKSTLVDLMMGLTNPSKGIIKINDLDIKKIKKKWQNVIGYVPQDVYLLDDSILKNLILFSDKKPNMDKINNVLKETNLEKTIKQLPKGIDTQIGERGATLSTGQRQRLGIARALYINPKIIILDEPTSSLDVKNELLIINKLFKLKDITLVVITHNNKILKKFDKVISIKNGKKIN